MSVFAMTQMTSVKPACLHAKGFTTRRPSRSACRHVCRASQKQVAKPAKHLAGVAGALFGAAAAMQLFTAPAADAIATQTDMYARPQTSDNKGQKTGQPDQQKFDNQPGTGAAIATSGAAEKGGMPTTDDQADENSRMQRSTSGSMSAAGPGSKAD